MNPSHRIAAILLLVAAGGCPAQDPETSPQVPGERAKAPLRFSPSAIDLGRISDETAIERRVTFVNQGKRTITIKAFKGDCSCILLSQVPAKRVYAPGEKGELEFVFDPKLRQGKERKDVILETDDLVAPVIKLPVSAEVIPRLQLEPRVVLFGQLHRRQVGPIRPLILILRDPDLVLESVEVEDRRFSLSKGAESKIVEDGVEARRIEYAVRFLGDDTIGRVQAQVTIKSNLAGTPERAVPLIAEVVGELTLLPDRVGLRLDAAGMPFSTEVVVFNRSGRPFRILDCRSEGLDQLQAKVSVKGPDARFRSSTVVLLEGLCPKHEAGERSNEIYGGKIVLTTDLADQPSISIPVTIRYAEEARQAGSGTANLFLRGP